MQTSISYRFDRKPNERRFPKFAIFDHRLGPPILSIIFAFATALSPQPASAQPLEQITPDISLENVRIVFSADPVGVRTNLIRGTVSFDCINKSKLERTLDIRDATGLVAEFVLTSHEGFEWRFNHYYGIDNPASCSAIPIRTHLSFPASSTNTMTAHLILDSPALLRVEGSSTTSQPIDSKPNRWKFSYRAQRADIKHQGELIWVIGEGDASVKKE